MSNPPQFEDFVEIIDAEIAKRRHKWSLTSINWMDYDDVSQIIRLHIFKKWHLYDPQKPIQPWLNIIIAHQIKNLIRNHYTSYARPCLRCGAAKDTNGCEIYTDQCSRCPLYARWQQRKQPATFIKIPVSIENHTNEVRNIFDDQSDIFRHITVMHKKMKEILKPIEWQIYEGLFIDGLEEEEVAKKLGYTSNEKGRKPRYKQISNIKKTIIQKARKCIENGEVDII